MPRQAQISLTGHKHLPLQDFASVADSIIEIVDRSSSVSHVDARNSSYHQSPSPKTNETPVANTDRGVIFPYSAGQLPKICKAHIFFADRAKTCKPWCKWPGRKPQRIEPSSRPSSRDSSPFRSGN